MRIQQRAWVLSGGAVLLYGAVAAWVNAAHGGDAAWRAALVQGLSSGVTTFTVALLVDHGLGWCAAGHRRTRAVSAGLALLAFAAASLQHLLLNLWSGTPELAATVALPIVAAAVFSAVYAAAAHRRPPQR